ncbi:MAG: M15 family metallopeptidase [Candidatus Neomarinimicrobiota bacterium]
MYEKQIGTHSRVIVLSVLLAFCIAHCDRDPQLVELNKVIPGVALDIRYATENNFVGKVLYPSARCFLIEPAAKALAKVQRDLKNQGFQLIVYDGYRPLSVQKQMWVILPNPDFVADPSKGSRHNRGYAVDVSLLDLNGNPVLMPTEFDNFTEKARCDYQDLPAEAIRHRRILEETMVRHGFIPMPSEWWHFDYKGYEGRPILDVPIDSLP